MCLHDCMTACFMKQEEAEDGEEEEDGEGDGLSDYER
jgi:hypothetical protein